MTNIFGTNICNTKFASGRNDPSEEHSRVWITPDSGVGDLIAQIEVELQGKQSCKAARARMTRAQVNDAVEALQKILADAGEQPIETVEVGAEISATLAEKLPVGSMVRCHANGQLYAVAERDHFGNALRHASGTRMVVKADVSVEVERIGPEPIIEPECDYIVDKDGDIWVRNQTRWNLGDDWEIGGALADARSRAADPNNDHLGSTFADLLAQSGPLTPCNEVTTIEKLPAIEKVA